MLDLSWIRSEPDKVRELIRRRKSTVDLDAFLALDTKWRQAVQQVDELRRERNEWSEKIPLLSATAKTNAVADVRKLKDQITEAEKSLQTMEEEHHRVWRDIPNDLDPAVGSGEGDSDNKEISRWGHIPKFGFAPLDHVALGAKLDWIDFDHATKVSGSKFYFLKNQAVLLDLALKHYAMDVLVESGFTPLKVPALAYKSVLDGTGFNPKGEETQIYSVENTDLAMIATSEISIGGYLKDEVVTEESLPLKFAGISECYRTEAGNYGRFSKGLYRVHHFDKVEMFIFCLPEQSKLMHQLILDVEEKVFQGLEIPYRIVDICDADMGAVAYRKYDLEAWMPGRGEGGDFGEVTSCSNCTDYQARRLNIKYRTKDGKSGFLHTLNGTAIAISRALIALMENNQLQDGRIKVPFNLRSYLGGKEVLG